MTDALPPLTRAERDELDWILEHAEEGWTIAVPPDMLRRLIIALDRKDALLRKLAKRKPTYYTNDYPEGMVCPFCDAPSQDQWVKFTHAADCPWDQARRETEGT